MKPLKIAGIVPESIVDGPGVRYALFVQGCPHHCPGCHNPQTHDFSGGTEVPPESILAELDHMPWISGITFSGGEPFCQPEALSWLAAQLKARGKHIIAYSGYTFEELTAMDDPFIRALLEKLDLLIDGRFILEQKSMELHFRGSTNQRILDMPASLVAGQPIWAEKYR